MTPLFFLSMVAVAFPFERADADTLVICPPVFQATLQPWIEYRQQQGRRILVQRPASTSTGLREQIRKVAENGALKNIVLIGDAADGRSTPDRLVPTDYVKAKVNVKFGSEPEIATDNSFADIDGDGVVDLSIGRIPVDTPAELAEYVDRVIAYENVSNCGPWQRKINFVTGGDGGFGQVIDKVIEQSVKRIVTDLLPAEYDTTMTCSNWRSPYCPDPRRFSETAIARFNEGCLFWVYMGHGNRGCLEQVKLPDRRYGILNNDTLPGIRANEGTPIALFMACYTASIDDAVDGLAENMLKQHGGPVAVIGSSRVSMPYAMGIFSLQMIDGYFDGQASTLGELVLQSKQRMVVDDGSKSELLQLIDSIGQAFSPEPDLLHEEKLEHVQLMHLLGDPLLKLNRPDELKIESPATTSPGETVTVTGTAKLPGSLLIDLSYRRDRFRTRPSRRREYVSTDESFHAYQSVYNQSQSRVCTSVCESIQAGPFSIQLAIPAECSGDCHIRALLTGSDSIALGSNDITIVTN